MSLLRFDFVSTDTVLEWPKSRNASRLFLWLYICMYCVYVLYVCTYSTYGFTLVVFTSTSGTSFTALLSANPYQLSPLSKRGGFCMF